MFCGGFQQHEQQKAKTECRIDKSQDAGAHTPHRHNKQRDKPNAISYILCIQFQLLLAHQINITFSDVDEKRHY